MHIRHLASLLCTLLLAACASLHSTTAAPSLKDASDAYFDASSSGDISKAASLLAEDHLFIGPTGKIQNKTARVAWLKDNQDWLPTVTVRDVQISQFGSTGRVTGIWVISDSNRLVLERFVHVWILQDGTWQMISHQVTELSGQ
jgi:ketosteroid isomerase-like protein